MSEVTELTVTLKNAEASYKQKFLLHEAYQMSIYDKVIQQCINETRENSKIEPEDISIRVSMVVQ